MQGFDGGSSSTQFSQSDASYFWPLTTASVDPRADGRPETMCCNTADRDRITGMSTHHLFDRQPGEREEAFTAFRTYLDLGADRSLAGVGLKLGKSKALMERWSSQWNWVKRVEAHTNHLCRQADLEQQREVKRRIVTSNETLEELSAIVRADPDEVEKLRYSDKLRAIELAGKHHHLFTEQIEITQSVDVNISLDVQAAIHAVVQSEHISESEAALRLAEQLADVPELAAMFREWATSLALQQPGTTHSWARES